MKEEHIESNEYYVRTASGMTIYTFEKKLSDFDVRTAVLLIHGAGVGFACWDINVADYSIMELLAQQGFDVFAVDQRGYGKSTKPHGLTVTSETSADDLKFVIDHIRNLRQVEKVDIVGHSFGGMVAVCLAGKYPECIGKIVSMSSPYKVIGLSWKPFLDEMVRMAAKGFSYLPNRHHLTLEEKIYAYQQKAVDAYKTLIDQVYSEWPTGVFSDLGSLTYSEYIPNVSAPTLLINGSLEYMVDPVDALHCLSDLGAKQKALFVVGNAYHLLFLEEIAHRSVNQAILAWLRL